MAANVKRAKVVSQSAPIDMDRLYGIESSWIADAHNRGTNARGLGQVTPSALAEYNQYNPRTPVRPEELFLTDQNMRVSDWYANTRVPQLLAAFNIPDTIENRLAAYNAGVGTLHKVMQGSRPLPTETVNYIRKYKNAKPRSVR